MAAYPRTQIKTNMEATETQKLGEAERSAGSSTYSGGLHGLVRRWAELAPDEVSINATAFMGHIWTAKDEHGDADSNLWFHGDDLDSWASLLAGVTYHSVRRGLDLVTNTGWGGVAVAWMHRPDEGSGRAEYSDPNGGVRAVLHAALTAYLERLEAV